MDLILEVLKWLGLLFLGGIGGIAIDNFIKRPKLVLNGGGSGGGPGPGFYRNRITILNEPGLFGPKFKGTTILGKRIHGRVEAGLVFDRIPAHECRARIYDKASGEFISALWWLTHPSPEVFTQTITLNSGESAELMIFARLDGERSKYFIFEPDSSSSNTPKVPEDEYKFNDTREFVIVISYFYGKKRFRTDIRMTKGFDGRLSYGTATGGGSF